MKTLKIYLALACLGISGAFAQDQHLTQYFQSPLSMNPALTGVFNGRLRATLSNRNQYYSLVDHYYKTTSASIDAPLGNLSIGGLVSNNSAGEVGYNNLNVYLSASYRISSEKDHFFLALQGGFGQKKFDMSKSSFDDNYNPILGYDPLANPSAESFGTTNVMYPDFNFGALWIHGDASSKATPFIGGTVFHLNEPDQAFSDGVTDRLPRKFLGHAGLKYILTPEVQLTPVVCYTYQQRARELSLGSMVDFLLGNSQATFQVGGFYRWNDAAALYAGINYRGLNVGVNYDFTTSSLSKPTNASGAVEFSVIYILSGKNFKSKFICPRI